MSLASMIAVGPRPVGWLFLIDKIVLFDKECEMPVEDSAPDADKNNLAPIPRVQFVAAT